MAESTMDMIAEVLEYEGFRGVAPDPQTRQAGEKRAAGAVCGNPHCNHRGLDYRVFTQGGRVREFGDCPRCGNVIEL